MKKCSNETCYRLAAKGRRVCNTCKSRKYRKDNPMRSAFHNLKNNAKRRNKEFSLTFEQFKEFCIATEYHSKRGVHRYSYTVDRIVETEGYHLDNIQVLTNRDNVKKYLTYVYSERQGNMIIVEKKSQIDPDAEDLPF